MIIQVDPKPNCLIITTLKAQGNFIFLFGTQLFNTFFQFFNARFAKSAEVNDFTHFHYLHMNWQILQIQSSIKMSFTLLLLLGCKGLWDLWWLSACERQYPVRNFCTIPEWSGIILFKAEVSHYLTLLENFLYFIQRIFLLPYTIIQLPKYS